MPESPAPDESTFVPDPPRRWFVRGLTVGLLLMGSVNALSYFVRSSDWGGLVGARTSSSESVGFPLKVWESGNTYGGMFADYPNMGWNILFAFAVGSLIGWLAVRRTDFLNRLIKEMMEGHTPDHQPQPIQFSLRGLMIATTIVAVAATVARSYAARPETLIAIYTLGPITLVAIAMLPRRLAWQKRVLIIIPATLMLIAIAIAVGTAIGMEFDKVLMGIFLCWTPQSALAAIGLTTMILISQARESSSRAGLSN